MKNLWRLLVLVAMAAGATAATLYAAGGVAAAEPYDLNAAGFQASGVRSSTDAGLICPPLGQSPAAVGCPKGTRSVLLQNSDTSRYCYFGERDLHYQEVPRWRNDAMAELSVRDSKVYCLCDGDGTTDGGKLVRSLCIK